MRDRRDGGDFHSAGGTRKRREHQSCCQAGCDLHETFLLLKKNVASGKGFESWSTNRSVPGRAAHSPPDVGLCPDHKLVAGRARPHAGEYIGIHDTG